MHLCPTTGELRPRCRAAAWRVTSCRHKEMAEQLAHLLSLRAGVADLYRHLLNSPGRSLASLATVHNTISG